MSFSSSWCSPKAYLVIFSSTSWRAFVEMDTAAQLSGLGRHEIVAVLAVEFLSCSVHVFLC